MEIKSYVKVTMVLDEDEAFWLKSLIQNPIHPEESPSDAKMRKAFWDALDAEDTQL